MTELMNERTTTAEQKDDLNFSYYLSFEVKSITFCDRGSCVGNVHVHLNGLSMSLGIMAGTDQRLWVSWPARQSRGGRYHALVWPDSEELRATVERKVLTAFLRKQMEKFGVLR